VILNLVISLGEGSIEWNFDVKIGRAPRETCRAAWNFGANSAFALGMRKTTENLGRADRSQDIPDAF
jgi:hypothetical protein